MECFLVLVEVLCSSGMILFVLDCCPFTFHISNCFALNFSLECFKTFVFVIVLLETDRNFGKTFLIDKGSCAS